MKNRSYNHHIFSTFTLFFRLPKSTPMVWVIQREDNTQTYVNVIQLLSKIIINNKTQLSVYIIPCYCIKTSNSPQKQEHRAIKPNWTKRDREFRKRRTFLSRRTWLRSPVISSSKSECKGSIRNWISSEPPTGLVLRPSLLHKPTPFRRREI